MVNFNVIFILHRLSWLPLEMFIHVVCHVGKCLAIRPRALRFVIEVVTFIRDGRNISHLFIHKLKFIHIKKKQPSLNKILKRRASDIQINTNKSDLIQELETSIVSNRKITRDDPTLRTVIRALFSRTLLYSVLVFVRARGTFRPLSSRRRLAKVCSSKRERPTNLAIVDAEDHDAGADNGDGTWPWPSLVDISLEMVEKNVINTAWKWTVWMCCGVVFDVCGTGGRRWSNFDIGIGSKK